MLHVLAMIAGCCIGSFLNVVFSRMDWYKGRSRCDACGYTLKWYDLIPIVSYLMLRGRCRKCKTKIALSHFISELMMGAAFLCGSLCFCRFDMCNAAVFVCGLIFISVAAIEDYKEQMVYSWILNSGICVTAAVKCIVLFMSEQTCGAWLMIVLVIAFKLIAYLISKESKAKIGAGDFDIFIIIFVMFGGWGLLLTVTYSSIAGCLIYLPPIIAKKRDMKEPLPFIPLLLIGTICNLII